MYQNNNLKKKYEDEYLPLNEIGRFKDEIVVDQFYSQDFCKGENGFPQSDVSMMLREQNQELMQQIAMRMNEIKAQYPDQNLSDEVLAKITVPRNVQSAVDFRAWASQIDELGFSKAVDSYIEAHKPKEVDGESKIDFSNDDNTES